MSADELVDNLERLSAKFEAWLQPKPAWTMAEISSGRREMLLKAIVGIVVTVERVEGAFKLNQTKSDADAASVADALSRAEELRRVGARRPVACPRAATGDLIETSEAKLDTTRKDFLT